MSGIKLVTLPIGNCEDITLRAINSLKVASIVYSEDTRVFKDFCRRADISLEGKSVRSFHDHSGDKQLESIIELAKTELIIFVSDAGSPIISDPAFPLITKAIDDGINIETNGGVSAVITALELSGLAPIPFHFHGFLARDKGKFNQDLSLIGSQYGTHIYFEGKSRVLATLESIAKAYPDNDIVLARELTKEFQSLHRFKGHEFNTVKDEITFKGEFVILVNNSVKSQSAQSSAQLKEMAQEIIDKGAKPKKLAKLLAEITGENSKSIYEAISISKK